MDVLDAKGYRNFIDLTSAARHIDVPSSQEPHLCRTCDDPLTNLNCASSSKYTAAAF
jgi:hypothetical protein